MSAAAAAAAAVSASALVTSQHAAVSSCRASPTTQMTRRDLRHHTIYCSQHAIPGSTTTRKPEALLGLLLSMHSCDYDDHDT